MKIMLSLFFAGKQKVPVMNYSMLCDIQFSGELFGPSEEYEKLSRPILLHFLSNTGICGDHAKNQVFFLDLQENSIFVKASLI